MRELMGILNVTPDSFSDGGEYMDPAEAVARAEQLFADGAGIVDVGGESTRPGATPISADEEWRRVEAVLAGLIPNHPGKISFDTYHYENVLRANEMGRFILNDVTGLQVDQFPNDTLRSILGKLDIPVIVSHVSPGFTITQAHAERPCKSLKDLVFDMHTICSSLLTWGISKDRIYLDPGLGFGKTQEVNEQAVELGYYIPEYPVVIGASKKRFLGPDRFNLAVNLAVARRALENEAAILRVHDVAGHKPLIDEFNQRDQAAS